MIVLNCAASLVPLASSSSPQVLSSLADVDFQRIRMDQLHSSHAKSGVAYPFISLRRGLNGAGYHRKLVTSIKIEGNGTLSESRVLLVENITQDIYIDLDQVEQ